MKIFTLNGAKTALNVFAGICIVTLIYFGFLHNSGAVVVSGEPTQTSYLALIINGFGHGACGTREFMYLDIPFTAGVMPDSPYTDDDVRRLVANGKDLMIYMPMEARNMRGVRLPDIHIMDAHTKADARAAILKANEQIRDARGITNHLGSRVMENEELVETILSTAAQSKLYFVESPGINRSKASEVAEGLGELGIRVYTADILLDGSGDIRRIERAIRSAAREANENGFAIAVGNLGDGGGKATAQAIMNMRDELAQMGIVFVNMSELTARLD